MSSDLKLGEIRGSYLLLARKINGSISKNREDENFLRGLFWLFEYVLYSAVSQKPIKDSESEKCFKVFSTKDYLGPGYNDLELTIKERTEELFLLRKTEDQLEIFKKGQLELDISYLYKVFKALRLNLQNDFLIDSEKGLIMVSSDGTKSNHTMSIDIVSNGTDIFFISF